MATYRDIEIAHEAHHTTQPDFHNLNLALEAEVLARIADGLRDYLKCPPGALTIAPAHRESAEAPTMANSFMPVERGQAVRCAMNLTVRNTPLSFSISVAGKTDGKFVVHLPSGKTAHLDLDDSKSFEQLYEAASDALLSKARQR